MSNRNHTELLCTLPSEHIQRTYRQRINEWMNGPVHQVHQLRSSSGRHCELTHQIRNTEDNSCSLQVTAIKVLAARWQEGMKDFRGPFVFPQGAVKWQPEGIKASSEDRMWSRWEPIPLAVWTTCLSHKDHKSLCCTPIILGTNTLVFCRQSPKAANKEKNRSNSFNDRLFFFVWLQNT